MEPDDILRHQGRALGGMDSIERDIRELIELMRQLAAAGGIKGPVPPRMDVFVKVVNESLSVVSGLPRH